MEFSTQTSRFHIIAACGLSVLEFVLFTSLQTLNSVDLTHLES